jgi:hypothetical protein
VLLSLLSRGSHCDMTQSIKEISPFALQRTQKLNSLRVP